MASPFRYFRKNIKPLMAIFTVLLMIAWAGGSSLSTYFSRPATSENRVDAKATAVSWNGGSLSNQQLEQMLFRRRMLNQFLQQVYMQGARNAYEGGVEPSQLRVKPLMAQESKEAVVETHIFGEAARKAGMLVSDEALREYLNQLGRGQVTVDQMRAFLDNIETRSHMSRDEVLNALREEMLAQNFVNSSQFTYLTITPEQRWRDWRRVNDRVIVEAAAIPAESFLVDVKEPTEAELQEFYDKYKNDEPSPVISAGVELPSATPGFRIPRKIDLEFIEANFDNFVTKMEEKITDEEIAKYYEARKDPLFIKADTGLMEDKGEKKGADKGDKADDKAAPDAKGASDAKPGADAAQPPKADDKAAPADDKASPPAKKGDEKSKKKNGKQSSLNGEKSPFRMVAFLDDTAKTSNDDAAKADAGKAADPAAKAPELTLPAALAVPGAAPATPAAPKKPPEFQPLDQVKDVIRKQLAQEKVVEDLKKLVTNIDNQLEADFNKYFGEVLTAQADKKEPPAPPASLTDLAPLAEKNGLKSGVTGPLSYLEMRATAVGKSGVEGSRLGIAEMLFGSKEVDLYQPLSTRDIDVNQYIVLKKSDTPGRVPKLDEVRAEVVKAWKAQKAGELAEKHAQDLAKKANEAKTPLPTFFADDKEIKVVRTDPFAELTGGDVGVVNGQLQQQPYHMSQPSDIVALGPAFMKEVFRLKDGEVGAALNNDHTIAYVIRLVEHKPPLDELHSAYLTEANSWAGLRQMTEAHAQNSYGLMAREFMQGLGLKWEPNVNKTEQSEPQDGG